LEVGKRINGNVSRPDESRGSIVTYVFSYVDFFGVRHELEVEADTEKGAYAEFFRCLTPNFDADSVEIVDVIEPTEEEQANARADEDYVHYLSRGN
jgi:hypothetical protein